MLDIKIIREKPEDIKKDLKKRFLDDRVSLVDECLKKDEEWRKLKFEEDKLRKSRNTLSKEINEAKKKGQDVKKIISEAKKVPEKIKKIEEDRKKLEEELEKIQKKLPLIMHPSVPSGKDDSENVELRKQGKIPAFKFEPKNHVELLEERGLADFEKSGELSGNGFYVLKGDLALLNQALIRFTIDTMARKRYQYIEPPLMIRPHILHAAIDAEGFKDTIYGVEDEELALIGTSEHSLLGLHAGDAIPEEDLPKKYFSYTMCFRKEIGSHGINEKGLWRTHQFNKIEQFVFCKPSESFKYFDELLKNTEDIMKLLELPYRVLEICSGDLSIWKSKSYDLEVWRPTTKDYGEVASLSNCEDYQARDLDIKVVYKDNERDVLHTLNNTAVATSRILVAIIENYQNKDGSITIPKVLIPYMFGKEKI